MTWLASTDDERYRLDLPDIQEIGGTFLISSSRDLDCSQYDRLEDNSVTRGSYECYANQPDDVLGNNTATGTPDTPNSTDMTGTANESSDGDHGQNGLSTGAKAGIGVGCAAGFLVLAGGLFLFFRRRKRVSGRGSKHLQPEMLREKDGDAYGRVAMLGDDGQYHEMGQPPAEMPAGIEPRELSAAHGMTEMDGNKRRIPGGNK